MEPEPAQSYYEAAVANLRTLAVVALLHPRLALANIALEVWLIYGDVNEGKISRLEREYTGNYEGDVRYKLIKNDLESLLDSHLLSKESRSSLKWILSNGGTWRHTRMGVSVGQVLRAIGETIKLIGELRALSDPEPLVCDCKSATAYPFQSVFDAIPGTQVKRCCAQCGSPLFVPFELANPKEALLPYRAGVEQLIDFQYLSNNLSEEECNNLRAFFAANPL